MSERKIIEYHVEINGSEVTLMLIAEDAEAANELADALTEMVKGGMLNGSDEVPDE